MTHPTPDPDRDLPPITPEDHAALKRALDRPDLPEHFARVVLRMAEGSCAFRYEFGVPSKVAKLRRQVSDEQAFFRMSLFEGRNHQFEVEFNPSTQTIIRILG